MGAGHLVEGGDEGNQPFAGLERADERDQRPVDRDAQAPSTARSAPARARGREPFVVDPVGATTTGARTSHTARSRSAVTWLTQISTRGLTAARRMARRKNAALERTCHSGWSKNVQSWIVTAQGTGDRAGIV